MQRSVFAQELDLVFQGDPLAVSRLSQRIFINHLSENEIQTALRRIEAEMKRQNSQVFFLRGLMHHYGRGGPVNYPSAIELYDQAIQLGNAYAMYNRALMHQYGRGGPLNYPAAIKLYDHAIKLGHAPAMYNRAVMHQYGKGSPLDYPAAIAQMLNIKRHADFQGKETPVYVTTYFDQAVNRRLLTPSIIMRALQSLYPPKAHEQLDQSVQHILSLADLNLENSLLITIGAWLFTNSTLTKLNLRGNKCLGGVGLMQNSAIERLARALNGSYFFHRPSLEELNLANTGLQNQDIQTLLIHLSTNTSLKSLDISYNPDLTTEIAIYFDKMLANRSGQAQLAVKMDGNPLLDKIKQDFANINCVPDHTVSKTSTSSLRRRLSTPSLIPDNLVNINNITAEQKQALDQVKNTIYHMFQIYKIAANAYASKWYVRKDISIREKVVSAISKVPSIMAKIFGFGDLISGGSHLLENLSEHAEKLSGMIEASEQAIETAESLPSESWKLLVHQLIHRFHTLTGKAQVDDRLKVIARELSGSHNKEKSEFMGEVFIHHYKDQILLLPYKLLPMFISLIRMHIDRFLIQDTSKTIDPPVLLQWLVRTDLDVNVCLTLNNQARVLMRYMLQGCGLKLLDGQKNEIKIDLQIKQFEKGRWITTNGEVYGYREVDETTLKLLIKMIQNCKEGAKSDFELGFIRISNATLAKLQKAPQPLRARLCEFKTARALVGDLEIRIDGVEDRLEVLSQNSSSVQNGVRVRGIERQVGELEIRLSRKLSDADKKIEELIEDNRELNEKVKTLQLSSANQDAKIARLYREFNIDQDQDETEVAQDAEREVNILHVPVNINLEPARPNRHGFYQPAQEENDGQNEEIEEEQNMAVNGNPKTLHR